MDSDVSLRVRFFHQLNCVTVVEVLERAYLEELVQPFAFVSHRETATIATLWSLQWQLKEVVYRVPRCQL